MKMPMIALALSMMSAPALAATFVYVSNADDGTIGIYTLQADGALAPGARVEAAKVVMPIAVSPDKRFLIAAVRSKPYEAYTYSIDNKSGALKLGGKGPLSASTPPIVQMKQGTGPRHLIVSKDNKFVYLLNELTGTVTTLALDAKIGTLKEVDSASALPADTKLGPGQPRGAVGAPGQAPRNTDNDIWASDLYLTPNGKFLYAAERTSSSLGGFKVEGATGKLSYVGSTPTEKQPRGFAIDPSGKYVVVSGEKSDTISSFAIDGESGALKEIGKYPTGKVANWVEIVAFE